MTIIHVSVAYTFLVFWQAKVTVPARYKHHVISEIFALNLQLLHDDNVRLENVEHGVEGPFRTPWLVAKRVANAVDVPSCDADHFA